LIIEISYNKNYLSIDAESIMSSAGKGGILENWPADDSAYGSERILGEERKTTCLNI